jgi:Ni/Fe-hydrogenase subunit HybB-like protein
VTAPKRLALTCGYIILAVLIAVGLGVGIVRLINGMGATTNLSDDYPWGLWIVYDLFFCPFAAGAFMISAVAHIYNRKEYHPIARPVILAGFLGEVSVVVILLMDLGRWDQFYNTLIPWYWNLHSFMIQVSLCLTVYLGVLVMEFAPALLERLNWQKPLRAIRPLTILLAGVGIVLSTLHQSALGSLFLLMPYRLHPVWWSPLLPLLFFTSAAFSGLAMAMFVAMVSFRAFGCRLDLSLLTQLAKIAFIMLGIYLVFRLEDLVLAGEIGLIFSEGRLSLLFLAELLIGVIVPLILFGRRKGRESGSALIWGATCILVGVALNRTNVALLAQRDPAGVAYFPHWMEFVVAIAAVAVGVTLFTLAARLLPVMPTGVQNRRQGISPTRRPRWIVPGVGMTLLLLTIVVVVLLQPVVRAVGPQGETTPPLSMETSTMSHSQECRECHLEQTALSRAGADSHDLARLTIEPDPPEAPHGRLGCVTCHQGSGGTADPSVAHVALIADPSVIGSRGCLSCHHDLPNEVPQDRLRTPHDQVVHGQAVGVSCSDCHGGVGHGFDPVSGEVICPMGVCLDCHQTRQLDSELVECHVCHISPHQAVAALECSDCHRSIESWQDLGVVAHPMELVGRHAQAHCFDCHQKPDADGRLTSQCSACHQAPSESHYGPNCEACHTPTSFKDARLPPEMHPVALVGAHQGAACRGCHSEDQEKLEYICSDCHKPPEDHLPGGCGFCHTPEGWEESIAFVVNLAPHIPHDLGGRGG